MIKYFIIPLLIFHLSSNLFAQVSQLGNPLTFKNRVQKTGQFLTMPEVNVGEELRQDRLKSAQELTKVYRFGKEHDVAIDVFDSGLKTELPSGDFVYQVGIDCPNALSVNLIFDRFKLAEGVVLYVADADEKSFDGAYTSLNNNEAQTLGTELVNSSKVIVEVFVPKDKDGASVLRIGMVVHGYRTVQQYLKALNSSGECEIDVNCPQGFGWEKQRNSVAMMINGGGFCSGSLVNNTSGTIIPYFLTANHCGTSAASSCVYRFRYESPLGQADCGTSAPSVDGPTYMSINGAVLKANNFKF